MESFGVGGGVPASPATPAQARPSLAFAVLAERLCSSAVETGPQARPVALSDLKSTPNSRKPALSPARTETRARHVRPSLRTADPGSFEHRPGGCTWSFPGVCLCSLLSRVGPSCPEAGQMRVLASPGRATCGRQPGDKPRVRHVAQRPRLMATWLPD